MSVVKVVLSFLVPVMTAGICLAEPADSNLAAENAKLQQRVDNLEKEVAELKKLVTEQAKAASPAPQAPATPALSEADWEKLMAMVQRETAGKKPLWSELDIQLYGFIKADATYNSSRMADAIGGSLAKWVERDRGNENDDHFNLTARRTRLGLRIAGPESEGLRPSGVVEMDFAGSSDTETSNHLRMRLAYLKLDWPADRFSIMAGQDWDTFSPLVTPTINDGVGWWTGNIGVRRPQIRLTKEIALSDSVDLKLDGAIARTQGLSNSDPDLTGQSPDTPGDSGEDAGFPGFQGRAGLAFPSFLGYKSTILGVSGHWAKEELDRAPVGLPRTEDNFDSWSANIDLTQPVNSWLTVKGELFTGENLNSYNGGIGQGINTTTNQEIGSSGGWLAATLGPWDKVSFNFGAGIDDVDSGDLTSATSRERNRSIFGNVYYSLNKKTQIGFELSQWCTKYKDGEQADSIRAQTVFIYNF